MTTRVMSSEAASREPGEREPVTSEVVCPTFSPATSSASTGVVPAVPATVEARSAWFAGIAADESLAIAQLASLGGRVERLGEPFVSVLTGEVGAAELTRGQRSNEVVYHDYSLAGTLCEFMPLPFVLACQVNGRLVRPPKGQLVEWRPRLLAQAGLILLPEVRLRPLIEGVTESTRLAYEGVRLLFGCRWYLEPGTPVPYSAGFIETWCGIPRAKAVAAREYLRRYVLGQVATVACGRPKELQLFMPMEVA